MKVMKIYYICLVIIAWTNCQVFIEYDDDQKLTFCDDSSYQPNCFIEDLKIEFKKLLSVTVNNSKFPDEPLMGVVFNNCNFSKIKLNTDQVEFPFNQRISAIWKLSEGNLSFLFQESVRKIST